MTAISTDLPVLFPPARLTPTGRYNPPRQYDLTRLPAQAKAAGQAWADAFARLPVNQQRAIILRAVVGTLRSNARQAGHPEPIIMEAKYKPLEGGGYVLDQSQPMVPLRPEYGCDGYMPEAPTRSPRRPRSGRSARYITTQHPTSLAAWRTGKSLPVFDDIAVVVFEQQRAVLLASSQTLREFTEGRLSY